jgi:hypothetical protein
MVSHLIWFRLSPFISLGSCNHCNLACFLWSNNFEDPSSNERIRSTKKSNYLIGIRTHDLPVCSIVPEPTTPPRQSNSKHEEYLGSYNLIKKRRNVTWQTTKTV